MAPISDSLPVCKICGEQGSCYIIACTCDNVICCRCHEKDINCKGCDKAISNGTILMASERAAKGHVCPFFMMNAPNPQTLLSYHELKQRLFSSMRSDDHVICQAIKQLSIIQTPEMSQVLFRKFLFNMGFCLGLEAEIELKIKNIFQKLEAMESFTHNTFHIKLTTEGCKLVASWIQTIKSPTLNVLLSSILWATEARNLSSFTATKRPTLKPNNLHLYFTLNYLLLVVLIIFSGFDLANGEMCKGQKHGLVCTGDCQIKSYEKVKLKPMGNFNLLYSVYQLRINPNIKEGRLEKEIPSLLTGDIDKIFYETQTTFYNSFHFLGLIDATRSEYLTPFHKLRGDLGLYERESHFYIPAPNLIHEDIDQLMVLGFFDKIYHYQFYKETLAKESYACRLNIQYLDEQKKNISISTNIFDSEEIDKNSLIFHFWNNTVLISLNTLDFKTIYNSKQIFYKCKSSAIAIWPRLEKIQTKKDKCILQIKNNLYYFRGDNCRPENVINCTEQNYPVILYIIFFLIPALFILKWIIKQNYEFHDFI